MSKPGSARRKPAGGTHPSRWSEFRHFGPTPIRFDHHTTPKRLHPTRAVLYAAAELPRSDSGGDRGTSSGPPVLRTCLAEVYRERGVIELRRDDPYFVLLNLARPVRLLDLADSDWLVEAGGNAAISSGLRSTARHWSRAIYAEYSGADAPDGLFYTCSNVPQARSVVLWERGLTALPARPSLHLPLSHPSLRAEIEVHATQLRFDLT